MLSCHDMKKGEIYTCASCGLKLEVIEECKDDVSKEDCGCHDSGDSCTFSCCGCDLEKA